MKLRLSTLFFSLVILLTLSACSSQKEEGETPDDSSNSSIPTESVSIQPTNTAVAIEEAPEATVTPAIQAGAETEDSLDPKAISTQTNEEMVVEKVEPSGDFNDFEAQTFDIQLAYPDGWLVTEDPELGLIIESSIGIFETMLTAEGAAILILPRNDLADEDITEALRQSVFNFGPAPSVFIEYPTVSEVDGHDVAAAPFRERESGIEGIYAFIQNEDQGVFVFAASTGLAKAFYLGLLETTIGSVALGETLAGS